MMAIRTDGDNRLHMCTRVEVWHNNVKEIEITIGIFA